MLGITLETARRRGSHPSHERRVKTSLFLLLFAVAAVAGLAFVAAKPAHAQTAPFTPPRFQTDAPGDIAIVGNTLMTCPNPPSTACQNARDGTGTTTNLNNDAWNMQFVDVDNVGTTFNSSTAQFDLPDGGEVLFAGLYWGARKVVADPGGNMRDRVLFGTPAFGEEPYTQITGTIIGTSTAPATAVEAYQAFADVTPLVQAAGSGTYAVANVQGTPGANNMAGWSLVVVYREPGAPQRNLTVFDGFNSVAQGNTVDIPISGFRAPPDGPVQASLGVVAYEGDLGLTGDDLQFRGGNQQNFTYVTNDLNPRNNFFNGSITRDGVRVGPSRKNPDYVNQLGIDIDVLTRSDIIPNGATSATLRLTTNQDAYFPGVVTTAIDLYAPDVELNKSVTDLNGGEAEPGDILEYQVTARNEGQDRAENFVLTDDIPDNTAYVPGSLVEVQGANAGDKTDPADEDTAEFDAADNQVVFRLGAGATGTPTPSGGTLGIPPPSPGNPSTITFQVEVLESARGTEVCNQARAGFFSPALNRPLEDISDQACIPVPAAADLEIRKVDDPDPVRVGERITYTLTVTNNGPNTAEGVTVRDVLPNAVRFVSATPGPPVCTGPGPGLGGTVECDLGDLALNETRTITIVVEARRVVGERINTAEVESDTPDPDLDNNQDDEETTILRPTPPCADLTVKVKSPDRVKVGQRFPYTVTVRNPGPADVSDVVLTSRLPRSVQFVRAPAGCRYDRATRKVTCDLGDMPVGSEKQRRIVVKALEVGTVTLPGCAVRSGTPPCVPSNNTLDSAGARSAGGDEPRAPSAVGPETTVVVVAGPDGSSPRQGSSREEE